ncbi:hypothetical protein NNL21_36140 [Paenibacillus mendelii]|nr:hypothetical protein [Paenibacillus mendelii]
MGIHAGVRFKQDEACRLITGPRIFIGTTTQGIVERYHQTLDGDIANELKHIVKKSPWLETPNKVNMVEIIQVLNKERPAERVYAGPAYVFHNVQGKHTEAVRITHENIELLEQHFSTISRKLMLGSLSSRSYVIGLQCHFVVVQYRPVLVLKRACEPPRNFGESRTP